MTRRTGQKLSGRNDDGISHLLNAPSDCPELYDKPWVDNCKQLISDWSERVADNSIK
jgi:hypothetical protein